jgi:hypothetical protein
MRLFKAILTLPFWKDRTNPRIEAKQKPSRENRGGSFVPRNVVRAIGL